MRSWDLFVNTNRKASLTIFRVIMKNLGLKMQNFEGQGSPGEFLVLFLLDNLIIHVVWDS